MDDKNNTENKINIKRISKLTDYPLNGMIFISTVRSPVSKGIIKSISFPHLPKGYKCFSAKDIPGNNALYNSTFPILAHSEVSYKGQAVALIAGPDKEKLQEAINLTEVIIEEQSPDFKFDSYKSTQIISEKKIQTGKIDFDTNDNETIVKREYDVNPREHYYPEPNGAIVIFKNNKFIVHCATQWPFHVKKSIVQVMNINENDVIVSPTISYPHLDGKIWYPSVLAAQTALVASYYKKPVMLLLSRNEDFLYSTKSSPMHFCIKALLSSDGKLKSISTKIAINVGSCSPFALEMINNSSRAALGLFNCKNRSIICRAIKTNQVPMDAFVGFGSSSVNFAVERFSEECAIACNMDVDKWRLQNYIKRDCDGYIFPIKKNLQIETIYNSILKDSDFYRKHSAFELLRKKEKLGTGYGIGFSSGFQISNVELSKEIFDDPEITLILSKDSELTVSGNIFAGSRRSNNSWKKIIAENLEMESSSIVLESTETSSDPETSIRIHSVNNIAKLIESSCKLLQSKRFRQALPITVKKSLHLKNKQFSFSIEDTAFGACVVELELNTIDRKPKIKKIWLCIKAGKIISEESAKQAIERDAFIAVSQCLGEYLDINENCINNDSYRNYLFTRLNNSPEIEIKFIEDKSYPLGIGELPFSLIPPAFSNALSQATNKQNKSLPPYTGKKINRG